MAKTPPAGKQAFKVIDWHRFVAEVGKRYVPCVEIYLDGEGHEIGEGQVHAFPAPDQVHRLEKPE